jgi:Concanavalin A-like lectin/glucanases superfamily
MNSKNLRRRSGYTLASALCCLLAASSCSSSGSPSGTGGSGGSQTGTGGTASGGTDGGGAGGTGGAADAGTDGGGAEVAPTNCAGNAVSFNANVAGTGDQAKARVIVDFGASTDLPTGNDNRTIEFWAYVLPSSWAGDANTMFFYGTNNRVADGFGLDFGVNMGTMGTIDPFTNAIFDNDNQPSGITTTTAQWIHFAMTWDGTTVKAYVNGMLKASKAAPAATAQKTLMTGRTPLTIGGYDPNYFNGYIDELRIWNITRSDTDIASTMNRSLAGDETGLTGYWKFDEAPGATTAADSVTSAGHTAHNGTLMANMPANLPTFLTPATAPPIFCN